MIQYIVIQYYLSCKFNILGLSSVHSWIMHPKCGIFIPQFVAFNTIQASWHRGSINLVDSTKYYLKKWIVVTCAGTNATLYIKLWDLHKIMQLLLIKMKFIIYNFEERQSMTCTYIFYIYILCILYILWNIL